MSKRILICDDDLDLLSICKLHLEEAGWTVFTREHCREILKILKEVKPDIILMDNWIPDAGGIVTTKAIKKTARYKNLPIIYISSNPDLAMLSNEAGADAYLSKPFTIDELKETILSLVG